MYRSTLIQGFISQEKNRSSNYLHMICFIPHNSTAKKKKLKSISKLSGIPEKKVPSKRTTRDISVKENKKNNTMDRGEHRSFRETDLALFLYRHWRVVSKKYRVFVSLTARVPDVSGSVIDFYSTPLHCFCCFIPRFRQAVVHMARDYSFFWRFHTGRCSKILFSNYSTNLIAL